jgi:predicted small secreted protein
MTKILIIICLLITPVSLTGCTHSVYVDGKISG